MNFSPNVNIFIDAVLTALVYMPFVAVASLLIVTSFVYMMKIVKCLLVCLVRELKSISN